MDDIAGFKRCGFAAAGCRVALYAGFAEGDFQFDKVRRFDGDGAAVEESDVCGHIFLNEVERIAKQVFHDGDLFIRILIHEVVKFAVVVKVLHFFTLDMSKFELIDGVESTLQNSARNNVFNFGADKCRSFAGFNVLEIYDNEDIVAVLKGDTFSEIARSNKCHKNLLYFTKSIVFYPSD